VHISATYAAAQLFGERSLFYTRSQFYDATACEIATICRQLVGVPLALELAATRVPTLGVRGVTRWFVRQVQASDRRPAQRAAAALRRDVRSLPEGVS